MLKKTLFLCPVGNLKNVREKNLLKMGYAFKSIRHKIIVLMLCICTIVGCEKYGKLNNGKLRCQMGKKHALIQKGQRVLNQGVYKNRENRRNFDIVCKSVNQTENEVF